MEHTELDENINALGEKIRFEKDSIFNTPVTKESWEEMFDLMRTIQADFKGVRYPTRYERDIAWERFCKIRNEVYNYKNEQYEEVSHKHFKELQSELSDADFYWRTSTVVEMVTLGLYHGTVDEMKDAGKRLNQAQSHFNSVKFQMTRDHRNEIQQRIIDIREDHDVFWDNHRNYIAEKQELSKERAIAYQEKKAKGEEVKRRIQDNIENNKEKLEKAEATLEKLEQNKSNLEDKISEAYSDSYRERHEEWLSETEEKIQSVEEFIDKLKNWIREGEEKLDNWND